MNKKLHKTEEKNRKAIKFYYPKCKICSEKKNVNKNLLIILFVESCDNAECVLLLCDMNEMNLEATNCRKRATLSRECNRLFIQTICTELHELITGESILQMMIDCPLQKKGEEELAD
jgi:hypothetical protein